MGCGVDHGDQTLLAGAQYAAFRRGPLTIAAGTSGAFFKTSPRLATPDIQVHFLPFSTDKMGEKLHSFSGFTASIRQLRPESRGSLRIASADPAVPPEIWTNYLATEVDRTTNVEGLKILRKILQAPALASYVTEEADPGAGVSSDEALLSYCRQRGTTIYHPTWTCRMGNDPLAVVDQRLRVRGIEGLRVVDGSVMPDLVSGNTNAAITMIAEKASEMILQMRGNAAAHKKTCETQQKNAGTGVPSRQFDLIALLRGQNDCGDSWRQIGDRRVVSTVETLRAQSSGLAVRSNVQFKTPNGLGSESILEAPCIRDEGASSSQA